MKIPRILQFCSVDKSITSIIKAYLFENGITISYLANKMSMAQSNLTRLLKKNDISVNTLFTICEILKHDFFKDMSIQLNNKQTNFKVDHENINDLVIENLSLYRKLEFERNKK